eukprot:TRINITY_DN2460_c0_g1_i2.p1 TRINITY_DN2460_c0_g1~~TRINITY_DN2460_c0_g1_i2.p1  ORF type:complete len:152 (-),score=5.86 TRINITY_DN2460_c0_g1_i2:510-965(-)
METKKDQVEQWTTPYPFNGSRCGAIAQRPKIINIKENYSPIIIGCKGHTPRVSRKPMSEFSLSPLAVALTKKRVNWRTLGLKLNFTSAFLDSLYGDCCNNDSVMIDRILMRWILVMDEEATYAALKKVLDEIDEDASRVFMEWMRQRLACA